MSIKKEHLLIVLVFTALNAFSQKPGTFAFQIIPLGVFGGSDESNLSSYMVAPENSSNYVCLDAGTLRYGIQQAIDRGLFSGSATSALRNNVKAYLISHPHLDHVSGLVINSPDDTAKNIYALPFCIDVLKEKYFTWQGWANFGDEGEKPTLNKYHYVALDTGKEIKIENTDLFVQPFLLSHANPNQSTAFLIRFKEAYLLYLGDTGPDEIEKSRKLLVLWQRIAPLIRVKKLKAIFIETSFSDEQPTKNLYGHLSPSLLMKEMGILATLAGSNAMKDFPIVVTHMKPSPSDAVGKIRNELRNQNSIGLRLIFPKQAEKLEF